MSLLKKFFSKKSISWTEFQRDGIVRGIKNRDSWNRSWHKQMHAPVIKNEYTTVANQKKIEHNYNLPDEFKRKLEDYPKVFQPAGEKNAWKYLNSFTNKRGSNYQKHISKPLNIFQIPYIGTEIRFFHCFVTKMLFSFCKSIIPEDFKSAGPHLSFPGVKTRFKAFL